MYITEDEFTKIIDEEIRKVKGGWKVYPKKPKKGEKRRKALSKKPHKTYKDALSQLRAVERSKAMREGYVKKYIFKDNDTNLSIENVKAPPVLNINNLRSIMNRYYDESSREVINRKYPETIGRTKTTFAMNRQIQNFMNNLESDELYRLQEEIYKEARNKLLSFVYSVLEANPKTKSDYPTKGKVTDATKKSKLLLTRNDIPDVDMFNSLEQVPFRSVLRVALDPQEDVMGLQKNAMSFDLLNGESIEAQLDAYVDQVNLDKTDPKIGDDRNKKLIQYMNTGVV